MDVVVVKPRAEGKKNVGSAAWVSRGLGVALLFPVAILIVGLPIALAVRLVAEAVAWLKHWPSREIVFDQ